MSIPVVQLKYVNTDGTMRGPLPDVAGFSLGPILSDVGVLSFDYPQSGLNWNWLDEAAVSEIAVFVNGVEVLSMRARVTDMSGDEANSAESGTLWKYSGPTNLQLLEGAVVYPTSWPVTTSPKTVFTAATAGAIMKTLISRAITRGALSGITHASFSNTADSNGAAWTTQISLSLNHPNLLTVVRNLVDQGMCDIEMFGRDLRMYKAGTLSADRTAQAVPLVFRAGRDLADSPRRKSTRGMSTAVLVAGDNESGLYVEETDPTAVAAYGRIEKYMSQGSVKDEGSLRVYAESQLGLISTPRMEKSHGLEFGSDSPIAPIADFYVGDWAYSDVGRGLERLRIRQWVLKGESDGSVTGSVVLNDLFSEREELLARRIQGIIGGSDITGASQASPISPSTYDGIAPKAPTGQGASSSAYTDSSGQTFAQVTMTWVAPTENTNNTVLEDLDFYRVEWRYTTDPAGQWRFAGITNQTVLTWSPVLPNQYIRCRVRAVDRSGNVSTWTEIVADLLTGNDVLAPPVPATPSVSNYLGLLEIRWNGLGSAGEAMPPDFKHVEVHVSAIAGFAPTATTLLALLTGGSNIAYHKVAYGVPTFVKLISVDQVGNKSTASAQGSGTTVRVVDTDLAPGSVTFDQLAANAVTAAKIANGAVTAAKTAVAAIDPASGNLVANSVTSTQIAAGSIAASDIAAGAITTDKLTVANFRQSIVPNGGFEDVLAGVPLLWTITVGVLASTTDAYAGAYAASVQTPANGQVFLYSDTFPVEPGQAYGSSHQQKSATSGETSIGIVFSNTPGALYNDAGSIYVGFGNPILTTAYAKHQSQVTAPAGYRYGRLLLFVLQQTFAQTVLFDEVVFRQAGGSAFIENLAVTNAKIADLAVDNAKIGNLAVGSAKIADLAVTNAKIASLAVDDAKIGSLSAGKITAGSLTAAIILSGSIKTAASGMRVEVDGLGVRLYNSTDLTVDLNTSTGNALVTGTYRSGVYGERIDILPSGTLRIYPATGSDYGELANVAGGFKFSSIINASQRQGRALFDTTGIHLDHVDMNSTGSAKFSVEYSTVHGKAPVGGFRTDGQAASADGSPRRFFWLHTNLDGSDNAGSILNYRMTSSQPWLYAATYDVGLRFASTGRVDVVNGAMAARSISASAFTVISSRTAKKNVVDVPFSALAAVISTTSKQWEYVDDSIPRPPKPDVSLRKFDADGVEYWEDAEWENPQPPAGKHYGPMAEALQAAHPSLVITDPDGKLLTDVRDMIGVLWKAFEELNVKVDGKVSK